MLEQFADWTDRIAAGEVPQAPRRPQGIERNVVITEWDWADPKAYLHDVVSTDRRDPHVNANGLLYGALELSADYLPVLDPVHNTVTRVPLTVRDTATPIAAGPPAGAPSAYWGDTVLWSSKANVHNPMIDQKGRVWITAAVRPPDNPAFCKQGSSHPSAKLFPRQPLGAAARDVRPEDEEAHAHQHLLQHAPSDVRRGRESNVVDERRRTGGRLARHEEVRRDGRRGGVAGMDGDRPRLQRQRQARRVHRAEPARRSRRRTGASRHGLYAVAPAPDGSIWGSSLGFPGGIVRIVPGAHPPETTLAEYFETPYGNEKAKVQGFSPRGMDIDRNGVAWVALASGHMASFDRRKCTGPLNGPTATGQHCPEGWTLYTEPLPQMKGVTENGSAEGSYYTWVDQFERAAASAAAPARSGSGFTLLVAKRNTSCTSGIPRSFRSSNRSSTLRGEGPNGRGTHAQDARCLLGRIPEQVDEHESSSLPRRAAEQELAHVGAHLRIGELVALLVDRGQLPQRRRRSATTRPERVQRDPEEVRGRILDRVRSDPIVPTGAGTPPASALRRRLDCR